MLKATVLFNIFVEILIQKMDYLMNMKFKRTVFIVTNFFCNYLKIYTVTFDQFNASLLNKNINFLQFINFSLHKKYVYPSISRIHFLRIKRELF